MLLTRAPLYRGLLPFSLDLHVLGAPLTFVLSQDQTLQLNGELEILETRRGPSAPEVRRERPFRVARFSNWSSEEDRSSLRRVRTSGSFFVVRRGA